MRKSLLIALGLTLGGSASATSVPTGMQECKAVATQRCVAAPVVESSRQLAKNVKLETVRTSDGLRYKRLTTPRGVVERENLNTLMRHRVNQRAEAISGDYVQDFEDCTAEGWIPDGWSVESKDTANPNPWGTTEGDPNYFIGFNGDYFMYVSYAQAHCEEWLYTPQFQVKEFDQMSGLFWIDPVFMYSLEDEDVDWDAFDFINHNRIGEFKIMIKVDDGDWTLFHDFMDQYDTMSLSEIYALAMASEFAKASFSLDAYVGHTVQFAFVYEATDADSLGIDDFKVGAPSVDATYSLPSDHLFFGISQGLSYLGQSIYTQPVYSPISYEADVDAAGATYTWYYTSQDGSETLSSNDETLSITYEPRLTSESLIRNNLYPVPQLVATAPGASETTVSRYNYLQASGRAEYVFTSGLTQLGMSHFDYINEGLTFETSLDYPSIPWFGYNEYSDSYWTNYSYGEEPSESLYVHLNHILNIYIAPASPLVIDGAWLWAYGESLKTDHEFTLEILPVNADGTLSETPIATTTVKGADCTDMSTTDSKSYMLIPFTFDQPVTVCAEDGYSMYAVRIAGIHDCATYFAPLASSSDNPDGMAYGWFQRTHLYNGETKMGLSACASYTGHYTCFAIMLDAEYPYLKAAQDECTITDEAMVDLISYYDGADLNVVAPEWLTASVEGQYGDARLVLSTLPSADETEGDVVITGPGVKTTVKVKKSASSVKDIEMVTSQAPVDVYNAQGQMVLRQATPSQIQSLPAGLYISRGQKIIVK